MERNCDCVFLYVVVVLLFLTHVSARIQLDSRRFVAGSKSTTRNRDNFNVSSKQHTIKVNMIRAGSSLFSLDNIMNKTKSLDLNGKTDVLITTSFGSVFLDKKKKLAVNRNETVADLKLQVFSKFPGSPPVQIQKLYFSNRLLNDSEVIGNISSLAPLPILLDTISGTGVYNRSMSIAQALEAYVATVVQQAYIGTKLQQTHKPEDSASIASMDSPYFRSLFHSINESLYEKYGEDIALAKEAEREPETVSPDTAAWRSGEGAAAVSPLAAAIAKEFDLNWRGLRNFAYYSVILAGFAFYGSPSPGVILAIIPIMWLSKLRQLRLLFKISLYLALPVIYKLDFLMPLLPAPLQVIAEQSTTWEADPHVLPTSSSSISLWRRVKQLFQGTASRSSSNIGSRKRKKGSVTKGFSTARKLLRTKKAAPAAAAKYGKDGQEEAMDRTTSSTSSSLKQNEVGDEEEGDDVIDLDKAAADSEQIDAGAEEEDGEEEGGGSEEEGGGEEDPAADDDDWADDRADSRAEESGSSGEEAEGEAEAVEMEGDYEDDAGDFDETDYEGDENGNDDGAKDPYDDEGEEDDALLD